MNCLICKNNIFNSHDLLTFVIPLRTYLCDSCKRKFKSINKNLVISGLKVYCEYEYNDFFRETLLSYKNVNGEKQLANSFLQYRKYFLFLKYINYKVIIPPSFKEFEKRRGYNHMWHLAKLFKLNNVYSPFIKIKNIKQSDGNREEIEKNIVLKDDFDLSVFKNCKVLLFDDVITTGKTLRKCSSYLQNISLNSLKFHVLSTNRKEIVKNK